MSTKPQPTDQAPTDPAVALEHARKNMIEPARQPGQLLTGSEADLLKPYESGGDKAANGGA
jgi:hypothetical protein